MQVGDLVMWIGKDEDHGMMGVIAKIYHSTTSRRTWFDVQWSDGVLGKDIHHLEIMAVEDEERQQS